MAFKPSIYQEEIYDFIKNGFGNCVIRARAGSGKTTTIVEAIKVIPKTDKALFIAFNKSIVGELQERLKECNNVKVSTFHALGYSLLLSNFKKVYSLNVDVFKYVKYVKANVTELIPGVEDFEISRAKTVVDDFCKLVDFSRLYLVNSVKEVGILARRLGIFMDERQIEGVLKVLRWGSKNLSSIDFTDMIWMPNVLKVNSYNRYDWIFADECQDFSVASARMIELFKKKGCRCIFVGDDKQSIYGFAGSTEGVFDQLCNKQYTCVKTLPISYRCSAKVIDLAKTIVSDIEARPDAPIGSVVEGMFLNSVQDGDMVLSRNRSPLIKCFNELINMNVKCYFNGSEIGDDLVNVVSNVKHNNLDSEPTKESLIGRLYMQLFNKIDSVMRSEDLDYDDACSHESVVSIYDTIQCFEALLKDKQFSDDDTFKSHIKKIFVPEKNGVCLSTVHKAKGLESDNVYIYDVERMRTMADKDHQERNLLYVAITRAKNNLYFLDQKQYKTFGKLLNSKGSYAEHFKKIQEQMGIVKADGSKSKRNAVRTKIADEVSKKKAKDAPLKYKSNVKSSKWGKPMKT